MILSADVFVKSEEEIDSRCCLHLNYKCNNLSEDASVQIFSKNPKRKLVLD